MSSREWGLAAEDLLVQTLVTRTADEALHEPVLHGHASGDVVRSHPSQFATRRRLSLSIVSHPHNVSPPLRVCRRTEGLLRAPSSLSLYRPLPPTGYHEVLPIRLLVVPLRSLLNPRHRSLHTPEVVLPLIDRILPIEIRWRQV